MLTVEQRVKRFKDFGYNPIHLFGSWYLIRHKSRNYCKVSFYIPYQIKEEE